MSAPAREDFSVRTRDGVGLRARAVAAAGLPREAPLIVLVHGIAAPLEPTYDLPVPGYSFLEELAARGLRAVAFDHRGFGKSDRDARMARPPQPDPEGRGLHGLDDSVEDIRAVVEACRDRYRVDRLTLFGSSRGAIQVLAAANKHGKSIMTVPVLGTELTPELAKKALVDKGVRGVFYRTDSVIMRFGTRDGLRLREMCQ